MRKRNRLFYLSLSAVFLCGIALAVWALNYPEIWQRPPKTFLDFPTQDLHAICKLKRLKYLKPVFMTNAQIDKLKQLVKEGKPYVPQGNPKVTYYYSGPEVLIQFYHDEEPLHSVSLIFGMKISLLSNKSDWDHRYEVDPGGYSELVFMLSETYQKEIGNSVEQE